MTDIHAALRELVELQGKATKAPWERMELCDAPDMIRGPEGVIVCRPPSPGTYRDAWEDDAAFIPAARNFDLAALLRLLEAGKEVALVAKAFAELSGSLSDHRTDECPCSKGLCATCEVQERFETAFAAYDAAKDGGA